MPETSTVELQVQTAAHETATTDQPDPNEALIALTEARISGAPASEIARLEAATKTAPEPIAEPEAEPEASVEDAAVEEAPEEDEPETQPEGEKPPADDGKAARVRIHDPSDQAFISLRKGGMSAEEAHERVYGPIRPAAQAPAEAPEPEPPPPTGTAELEAERESLEALIDDAASMERFDADTANATKRLSRVNAEIVAAQQAEAQARLREASAMESRQSALNQAARDYPDLRDKTSIMFAVAAQVAREIQDPTHPDHEQTFGVNAVGFCAGIAAERLGKAAVQPAAQPVAKPVAAIQPKQPGPASGTRATAPAPPQPTAQSRAEEAEGRAMAAALGERYVPGRSYHVDATSQ